MKFQALSDYDGHTYQLVTSYPRFAIRRARTHSKGRPMGDRNWVLRDRTLNREYTYHSFPQALRGLRILISNSGINISTVGLVGVNLSPPPEPVSLGQKKSPWQHPKSGTYHCDWCDGTGELP